MPKCDNGLKGGLALVFSGGGAKGAYEIGVWKALRETGLDKEVSAVSGCSIGALNAMFFATGDYGSAFELWLRLSDPGFRKRETNRFREIYGGRDKETIGYTLLRKAFSDSFISQALLERTVYGLACGNEELLHRYRIFSSATRIRDKAELIKIMAGPGRKRRKPDYISWDSLEAADIAKAVMASTAMPVVYEPVEFCGSLYCDGSLTDNTPLTPLYECGYRRFIVVHLDHRNSYFVKTSLKTQRLNGISALNIIPGKGFRTDLPSMVTLTPELTERRVNAGYEDASRKLVRFIRKKE